MLMPRVRKSCRAVNASEAIWSAPGRLEAKEAGVCHLQALFASAVQNEDVEPVWIQLEVKPSQLLERFCPMPWKVVEFPDYLIRDLVVNEEVCRGGILLGRRGRRLKPVSQP